MTSSAAAAQSRSAVLYGETAWDKEVAGLIRQHNNANVLVMPGRFIANKLAETIMDEFFKTPFEGGRHERRVEKIPVK